MYILIVGAGRVGAAVARQLLMAEHEITVIDNDPERCMVIEEEFGGVVVLGEGAEAAILGRAGANRANVFIATTRRDDDNLVACQLAKHWFGATRVVALVNVPEHVELFNRLGIDVSVNTAQLLVDKIEDSLSTMLTEEVGGF
ncbi:MAG: TrkA family potassium uptake protein [SAR202 cluster bacterium]|jgi:trk system potassium uptake protein TrkA|nr:hypothetical protein [Chloroflexota bacterium]MDP6420422.1 TrkA family potassium uptake protein [SAR202 cluster bacterium]HAL47557.1 hypothetical protein [Dehalococcoidia bacterium]MDP6662787.1 TrkA family potassium uptake protein [SAR202 cluster bacterium]MDP6800219.1 TrkA family potassium uptake protein [SAR202 cluster bacterium]|tara:strand:+ start:5435 stop:5863 length:429 start_codon:yes stop_codon:yes gene_type:complete